MTDPDELLTTIRSAIAEKYPVAACLAFGKLDDQLRNGGPLPSDWVTEDDAS